MLITRVRAVVLGMLGITAAGTLHAQTPREIVRLDYAGDASCPDERRFMAEVGARLRHRLSWSGEPRSKRLTVRVVRHGDAVLGTLRVEDGQSAPSFREFTAATCDDAVIAVALVAALALDPNASTAPGSALRLAPPDETPLAPPEAPREAPAESPANADAAASPSLDWSAELGAVAAASAGPAPELLASAGLQLAFDARAVRRALLAPRLSLSALIARSGTLSPDSDDARFTWAVARLTGCPARLGLGARWTLRPCAVVDAGLTVVTGRADAIAEPQTVRIPWFASGLSLLLHYRQHDFFAIAGAGVLATLNQRTYVFENPTVPVHDVPLATWTAELGLGFVL